MEVVGDVIEEEREPNPLQLARRDAVDVVVVVGDIIESVLRSLSLRFNASGLVDKGNGSSGVVVALVDPRICFHPSKPPSASTPRMSG